MSDGGQGEQGDGGRRWTVGSLTGLPVGSTVPSGAGTSNGSERGVRTASGGPLLPETFEGPGWVITRGEVSTAGSGEAFMPDGTEGMSYNNPFAQVLERVWFDDKIVFALDAGEVDIDPGKVKVAQEYQVVYAVELDERGKLKTKREVEGQYNIYDSVPGMEIYSPIWQFNYVIVPESYRPNTLRSAGGCVASGYPIVRSNVFEN